jgi:uncharacterized membrane protein/predicted DsbA family dithiol-disulfide isomerase
MILPHRIHVMRPLALLALTVSVALLVVYLRPELRLCGYQSRCDEVLSSPFGRVLGVPLPVAGIVTFGLIFGLTLVPVPRLSWWLRPLALAAGAGGALLLVLQIVVLGRLCPGCVIVDVSAVLLAVVELCWGPAGRPVPAPGNRGRLLWLAAAFLALGSAAAVGTAGGPPGPDGPVPPQVSALWIPGKVTLVEVADFECPHCRQAHVVLKHLLREEGDRVRLVQLTAPMRAHRNSRDAARAFLCAGQQGKGREMAEALFGVETPTPGVCEGLAESLGLSPPVFRTCVAAPETDARLDAETAWVKEASPEGLPVLWVQRRRLYGPQDLETLRLAVRAAEQDLAGGATTASD